jgi:tRNA threonylcarbamoyladenosine biosynthesis protein TsaB
MIICLETATNICSVALCNSDGVISVKESSESKSHASLLTIYIMEILEKNGLSINDLEAIAVSKGPGSYTGLRIGVSVAKGIAYAASLPLIGVDTTLSMFFGISEQTDIGKAAAKDTLFCPMLDARRMEVYYAIYDSNGGRIKEIVAEIINEDSFINIPESRKIIFFGDGAAKCREVIKRTNVHFDENFRISASHMQRPAFQAIKNHQYEDVAYFEPFYLKDFITTKPRKNILGEKMA